VKHLEVVELDSVSDVRLCCLAGNLNTIIEEGFIIRVPIFMPANVYFRFLVWM
jgi:hypothetical protein